MKSTLKRLLNTAILPVGNTMYVWGGGWNEDDTGAGREAVTEGVSPIWKKFADRQTAEYDINDTRFQIHNGLDCSGYIGWAVYNCFYGNWGEETGGNKEICGNTMAGFVYKSSLVSQNFAQLGWGECISNDDNDRKKIFMAGDICSMPDHVWMSLGMCGDGSVVLVHSSPPGVRISGTKPADGESSEAVKIAEWCMRTYYKKWFDRYPECSADCRYLEQAVIFRWNKETMTDLERVQGKSGGDVVRELYLEHSDSGMENNI